MPPQSRSQRRRQAARQQQRPVSANARSASQSKNMVVEPAADPVAVEELTLPSLEPAESARATDTRYADSSVSASSMARSGTASVARSSRRVKARPAPEPIDYSKDYAAARRDLRWIVLWACLLLVAMVALRLSGIV